MRITEFRIFAPFNQVDLNKAYIYVVSRSSKETSGGGEGIELLKPLNKPKNLEETGDEISSVKNIKDKMPDVQIKRIYANKRVPVFIRKFFPDSAFILEEKFYRDDQGSHTIYSNDYLKENFTLEVHTTHRAGYSEEDNVFNLSAAEKKIRKIDLVDIGTPMSKLYQKIFKSTEDPTKLEKNPLYKKWFTNEETSKTKIPVTTCFKMVKVHIRFFPLSNAGELLALSICRHVFGNVFRKAYVWKDEFLSKTIDELKMYEEQSFIDAKKALQLEVVDIENDDECGDEIELEQDEVE